MSIRYALPLCLALIAAVLPAQVVTMTNDECSSAIMIIDGVNPNAPSGLSGNYYTNAGATASAGSPALCVSSGNDVWFAYVSTGTGNVTINACTPAGFTAVTPNDTVIQILDASACPPTTVIACNDDSCGTRSSVSFPATVGTAYYVRVIGYSNSTVNFYLTAVPAVPAPANDNCSGAVALSYGTNGPFSNGGASDGAITSSCGNSGHNDTWYSVVAQCTGTLTVSTPCVGFDTVLTAYGACGGAELACNDDDPTGSCGFGGSRINFPVTAGQSYLIRAASYAAGATGNFTIDVAPGAGMALAFSSPFGAGSIQVNMTGGPINGGYFLALTFNQGGYPNGWLYGIDIPLPEVSSLIGTGYPFLGLLGSCGEAQIGPISGANALSGVPFYAVALGLPAGSSTPSVHSAAMTTSIP